MTFVFFFNDTATTEIYTLSLHDALPISAAPADLLHLLGMAAGLRLDVGPADVREAGQPRPAQGQAADRLVAAALPRVDLAGGVADAVVGVDPLAAGRDGRVAECHGGAGTRGGQVCSGPGAGCGRPAVGGRRDGDSRRLLGELGGGWSAAAGTVDRDGDPVPPTHGRAPAAARTGLPGEALTGAHAGHLRAATSATAIGDRRPGLDRRSEERRVGKECRSRWSLY